MKAALWPSETSGGDFRFIRHLRQVGENSGVVGGVRSFGTVDVAAAGRAPQRFTPRRFSFALTMLRGGRAAAGEISGLTMGRIREDITEDRSMSLSSR